MAKNQRRRSGNSGKITVIRGKGPLNAALSSTSAVGAFVATRYEIDTTLCPSWGQLGQVFAKWRIRSLVFHFAALKSTSTEGNVGICVLPDPQETTPISSSTGLSMQFAAFGPIRNNLTLRYRPPKATWLFTRDATLLDDRLEMPGDVVYWTENTTASFAPGVPWVSYVVEFTSVTNSTVAPLLKQPSVKPQPRDNGVPSEKQVSLPENMNQGVDSDLVLKAEVDDMKYQLATLLDKLGKLDL